MSEQPLRTKVPEGVKVRLSYVRKIDGEVRSLLDCMAQDMVLYELPRDKKDADILFRSELLKLDLIKDWWDIYIFGWSHYSA